MADTQANQWALEASTALDNFKKLVDQARQIEAAICETRPGLYIRRKFQLVFSLLLHINVMICDGMNFVLKGMSTAGVSETLDHAYTLRQDLTTFGNLPKERKDIYLYFDDEKDFRCPNPLVLFLKLALESGEYRRNLGGIQKLLNLLSLSPVGNYSKYFPGMPSCVFALQRDGHDLIISATRDKYQEKSALEFTSRDLWQSQLVRQEKRCSEFNSGQVQQLKTLSKDFSDVIKTEGVSKDLHVQVNHLTFCKFLKDRAEDQGQSRIDFTGTAASWQANGSYKPSCLLDHYRFKTNRPLGNRKPTTAVWGPTSCAEWFAFLELASLDIEVQGVPLLNQMTADRRSYARNANAEG
ncbi:MAG: hypothetical protein M1814_000940 [Vezdaea aestivalis]|nr:MAG: hypothetical protein M1814_000940 [Vezdaea aestivalis]